MNESKLLRPYKLDSIELKNRMVMAPMTRCRAIGHIPNELMGIYYRQRSDSGLIVTEGTSPSPNGLGYARIPGCFDQLHVDGWIRSTSLVHIAGGKIFLQIMHTGRISHPLNMPDGAKILAPSAVKAAGQMWTDARQMQDYIEPQAMTTADIERVVAEYVSSARYAMSAWFDGVELHAANGYLLEQFLSPHTNLRTDNYGGSIENRCRLVLEVVAAVATDIGKGKTAIRLSPYGAANDMAPYPEIDATYNYLATKLNDLGIVYIHIVDHSAMGSPTVPIEIKKAIRTNFKNTIILCGGYDQQRAEVDISSGLCDLVAFGRPFINNPDLVDRFKNNWPLSTELHQDTFYSVGEKGYTDYPIHIYEPVAEIV